MQNLETKVKEYVERLWNERKISYNWTKQDEANLVNFIKASADGMSDLLGKADLPPVQKPDIETFVNDFIYTKLYDYGLIEDSSFCQRGSAKGDLIYKDMIKIIDRLLSA